jgi:SNF2-related domain/Helicase conserved C-terminal domain
MNGKTLGEKVARGTCGPLSAESSGRPGRKKSARRRIGIRDRLSRLTYRSACRLLGEGDDGIRRLRNGGQFEILICEHVRLLGDMLVVQVPDPHVAGGIATVNVVERPEEPGNLRLNCNRCQLRCDHMGAALGLVLDEKLTLGLSEEPDPDEPVENLTEKELLRRAVADRERRAASEPMRVKSLENATPWTDYVVTSRVSGRSWRVSLRGFRPGESYCSCPDYRTNQLGTCKHVIHVQRKIAKRFSQEELAKPYRRKGLSLRLDYGEQPGIRFNLPHKLPDRAREILGRNIDRSLTSPTAVVKCLRALEKEDFPVHVYPDAEEWIQRQLILDRVQRVAEDIRKDPSQHPLRETLLKVPLLPYQLDGIAFAASAGRAILADDMGLGKTIQGIGVAELLHQLAGVGKVLVVCPASLKSQWKSEVARFSKQTCNLVVGSASERARQYGNESFFTVVNYEQVLRDHAVIEQIRWDLIILDEGQRIKNWESKTSQMIKSLRSRFALVLSGTPLENRLEELYTVVSFVDDRRLGPLYRFFHQHRTVDDSGRIDGYRNLDELREKLKPVLLRRTRSQVMEELPERSTEIVRIRPTDEQAGMSNEYFKRAAQIAAKAWLTEMDLLRIQKFLLMSRMACNSTYLVDKEEPGFSSKLERLAELLDQLSQEEDRKIILFSEWTTMLDLIEPLAKRSGLDFVRLDGSVPQKKRQEIVHTFQNDRSCRLILLSNAGNTGLNLQAANTVINVDLPWNPAVLEQRISRAHRMGQKRPVQVFVLVTEDSIEERMLGTLSSKHDLALAALDADSDVTELGLRSGIDELKKRLEKLLGNSPAAPIDVSEQRRAESEARQVVQRDRVAAASGQLLGAALQLVGELVNPHQTPDATMVDLVRNGLDQCIDRNSEGRLQLRIELSDESEIRNLASALARLLIPPAPAHNG